MKSKLHLGILVVLITFLLRYLETSVVHNQQIVVQFSDVEISEADTQKAIEAIKLKLHAIGIQQIQVGQDIEGHLKITYYSTTDVKNIQSILSNEGDFKLAHNFDNTHSDDVPAERESRDYKLNVSEIQNNSDTIDWNFDGIQVVERNQKSDRFNHFEGNSLVNQSAAELLNAQVKVAINAFNSSLSVDKHSYKIPEVRAGPKTS